MVSIPGSAEESKANMDDNQNTFCNESLSENLRTKVALGIAVTGIVSLCVCICAVILLGWQKMYKTFTHRLVLYLLLYSMVEAVSYALRAGGAIESFVYSESYTPFCSFSGFFTLYLNFAQLLTQTVITFHIGCVVVLVELRCTRPLGLHYLSITSAFESESSTRNAKRYAVYLELIYALSPAVLPLLFVWVPFITGDYGKAGLWCWIRRVNDNCELVISGVIQQYTLWYGPLLLLTLINTCVIITTIIIICWKAYQFKKSGETPTDYKNTLKQVLPILAYPVIFQILNWFALAHRIVNLINSTTPVLVPLLIAHTAVIPTHGLFSAAAFLVYFTVWKKQTKNDVRQQRLLPADDLEDSGRLSNYVQYK